MNPLKSIIIFLLFLTIFIKFFIYNTLFINYWYLYLHFIIGYSIYPLIVVILIKVIY